MYQAPHRRGGPLRRRTLPASAVAIALAVSAATAVAQPANDACTAQVPLLTVSAPDEGLTFAGVTTVGARPGRVTTCANVSVDDDVYYRFVATAPGLSFHFRDLVATAGERSGVGYAIYEACDGRELACAARLGRDETAAAAPVGLAAPLVPGQTYYLQTYLGGEDNEGTFELALRGLASGAPNDFCGGELPLLPTGEEDAPVYTPVSTDGATQGPGLACSQTWINDDLWYRFVAAGGDVRIGFRDLAATRGTVDGIGYALYATCDSAALTCVARFGEGLTAAAERPVLPTRLTAGETYLLRVWTGGADNAGTFGLSVESFDAAVDNDACADARAIALDFDRDSTEVVPVNTVGATASPEARECLGDDRDDDVWFDFEAISDNLIVSYRNFAPVDPGSAGVGYVLVDGCDGGVLACGTVRAQRDGTGIEFANPEPGLEPGRRYRLGLFVLGEGGGAFTARIRGDDRAPIARPPADGACVTVAAVADGQGGVVRFLDPDGGLIASFLNQQDLGLATLTFGSVAEGPLARYGTGEVPYLSRYVTIGSERAPTQAVRLALYLPSAEVDALFAAAGIDNFTALDFVRRDSTACGTAFGGDGERNGVRSILDYPRGYYVEARPRALGEFFVAPESVVGVRERPDPAARLTVWPNPAAAGAAVAVDLAGFAPEGGAVVLTVADVTGRQVGPATVARPGGTPVLTGLAAGVHLVVARSDRRAAVARVVVR